MPCLSLENEKIKKKKQTFDALIEELGENAYSMPIELPRNYLCWKVNFFGDYLDELISWFCFHYWFSLFSIKKFPEGFGHISCLRLTFNRKQITVFVIIFHVDENSICLNWEEHLQNRICWFLS